MSLPTPAPVRASAIDLAVEAARARIRPRVTPERLAEELTRGALVVDTRSEALRRRDGAIDGAVAIERNVLEWRLDPTSAQRMTGMDDPHRRVIIVCDEGYASSLAAAGLLELGLTNVTDLVGGYQGWRHLSGTSEPRTVPER